MRKVDKEAKQRYLDKLRLIRESGQLHIDESPEQMQAVLKRCQDGDFDFFVQKFFPHYATDPCAKFQIKSFKVMLKDPRYLGVREEARGHAKTTRACVFEPIYLWAFDDLKNCLITSVNGGMAKVLLSDLQAEFEANAMLIKYFGEQKTNGDWADGQFRTKNGAMFSSRGRGEKLRGLKNGPIRVQHVVADDLDDDEQSRNPKRVKQTIEWFNKAVMGLGDKGTFRVVIVNNRIAEHTVMGHFAAHPKWDHRKVNALDKNGVPSWPEKYTKQYFRDLEASTNYVTFQTEYMNNPIVEGDVYKLEQFQKGKVPPLNKFDHIVGYWDIAFTGNKTSDFNAVDVEGFIDGDFWTIDCYCRQSGMKQAIHWMYDRDEEFKKKGVHIIWYCERQFWNAPVEDAMAEVAKERGYELAIIRDDRQKGNKVDRMISMSFYWQRLRKWYNEAKWNGYDMKTMVAQTLAVGPGMKGKDDGPDATEGAVSKLQIRTRTMSREPIVGRRSRPDSY
jgi:phage terminase large subunit-like protein